jgi:gluconate 2-dehydrogenase gamma chain
MIIILPHVERTSMRAAPHAGLDLRQVVPLAGLAARVHAFGNAPNNARDRRSMSMTERLARRAFLLAAGAAPAAALPLAASIAAETPAAPQPAAAPPALLVLTDAEAAFLTAAADTMIPADDLSPAGSDCGVVAYIDGQLASAWGGGDKLYRYGPHKPGTPQQGSQQILTPREFLGAGIVEANAWCHDTYGKTFDDLAPAQRIEALQQIESGKAQFASMHPVAFFDLLLDLTMEGMFADPIYGGNRDMAGWKMLGFPGLPATYGDKMVAYSGKRYQAPPKSIADFL